MPIRLANLNDRKLIHDFINLPWERITFFQNQINCLIICTKVMVQSNIILF